MAQEYQLSAEQEAQLKEIAAGDTVYSQRARALLSLASGSTQAAAAGEVGLSVSAVRYWRSKFMDQGLGIFPEAISTEPAAAGTKTGKKKNKKSGDKKKKSPKNGKSKKKSNKKNGKKKNTKKKSKKKKKNKQ